MHFYDKNGIIIEIGNDVTDDDVLYDGNHYHRIYVSKSEPTLGQIEMLSCTFGYTHNVTQEICNNLVRIGKYKDYQHLFNCD